MKGRLTPWSKPGKQEPVKTLLHFCAFLVTLCPGMTRVKAEDFNDEIKKVVESVKFKEASQKAEKLMQEDKLEEANVVFTTVFPEQGLTAAEAFILGNTFFTTDDALARNYHEIALKALPDEPVVQLEWAIDLHREGKPAEALPYYQKYVAAEKGHYLGHTLLADCLIRTGNLKAAIEHWNLADHPSNHVGIDFAIHTIYGKDSPFRRRHQLLKAIEGGDVGKLDELMDLSASWDRDWWNAKTRKDLLERDLALARKLLKDTPLQLAELELYAETYVREDVEAEWLKQQLVKNNWLMGDGAKLPASELIVDRLLILVFRHELEKPGTLLQRFEEELRERGSKSVVALNTLASLLLQSGEKNPEKLAAIDKIGWEQHGDARFAASLLAGMVGQGSLKSGSELLSKARKQFPEHEFLEILAFQLAQKEKKALEPFLIEAIKAEFRHLSRRPIGVIKDSYRLKALFALLEKELTGA